MALKIEPIIPASPRKPSENEERTVLELETFEDREEDDVSGIVNSVGVPIFRVLNEDYGHYVLFKDLAIAWGYPSSYQLINKILKRTKISKERLVKVSNRELNSQLLNAGLIKKEESKFSLFYTKFSTVYTLVKNKGVFSSEGDRTIAGSGGNEAGAEGLESNDVDGDVNMNEITNAETSVESSVAKVNGNVPEDQITISQVFPYYGISNPNAPLNYSYFNCLKYLTKLNYYKSVPSAYKYLPNTKLSYSERVLIYRENDFCEIQIDDNNKDQARDGNNRKQIGKSKKHTIDIDPNTIDLTESVIPGQGFIQEFNVNHLCKVPSYYIKSNQQTSSANSSDFDTKNLGKSSNSSHLFNEGIKLPKEVQNLTFSNEADNSNYSKYFYTKTYRGPGSGNYKDASIMNRINKIQTVPKLGKSHKVTKQVIKPPNVRYNQNLKGLVHDKFDKKSVDRLLQSHRNYTEDYLNLEMLHSNAQFNLLANTYREMSEDTWKNYYKFKLTDFEQLGALQRERKEIEAQKDFVKKYSEWQKAETERQEKIRTKTERIRRKKERVHMRKLQKQREIEEQRRRRQLEASFNDPFGDDGADVFLAKLDDNDAEDNSSEESEAEASLYLPIPQPVPPQISQLEVLDKFTLPTFYPEIVKSLPLELRKSLQDDPDEIPPISKAIRYTSTTPDPNNPELLIKLEIFKLPNPNALGWDNLRKFKEE